MGSDSIPQIGSETDKLCCYRMVKFIIRLKETNMPIKQIQYYSQLRYEGDNTIKNTFELFILN